MELDFEQIKKLIPQRFPFIMIDRVLNVDPGKEALAVKNVSGNDILFLGHFPEKAIMPGVALIEAMAQALPVVTGRSGAVSESVIDGETGILFEPGDVDAHAEALRSLVLDKPLRLAFGHAGWDRAKTSFSVAKEKKSLTAILEERS